VFVGLLLIGCLVFLFFLCCVFLFGRQIAHRHRCLAGFALCLFSVSGTLDVERGSTRVLVSFGYSSVLRFKVYSHRNTDDYQLGTMNIPIVHSSNRPTEEREHRNLTREDKTGEQRWKHEQQETRQPRHAERKKDETMNVQ